MQTTKEIIIRLNKVLTGELTSINQFFLHARIFKNWGLSQLDSHCYKKSILDMKQADQLIERILFLEGLPNLQQLQALAIGEHSLEMLKCDLDFLTRQLPVIKDAIAYCEEQQDYVSRDMLCEILSGEEEYIDFIEAQLYQIDEIGLENYLQAQL